MKYVTEIVLVIATIVVILLTMVFDSAYYTKPVLNAQEIIRQISLLGIFAIGAGIVIISGGIDLSSGSVIAFGGSMCALTMYCLAPLDEFGSPDTQSLGYGVIASAIFITVVIGFLIGTFHAWLITVIKLPPFVATLASLVGLRSLSRIINQYLTELYGNRSIKINIDDPAFSIIGKTWWVPLIIFLLVGLFAWFLMSRTVIGRHLYALGGNEEAAKLSGIRTDQLKWLAYCIGSITASIAGILYTAEVGSADPITQGLGYELNAIAAAVVGGCSLQGGVGVVPAIMLGVVFLRVVIDAVAKIIGAGSDDYEGLIVGVLVVLAVAFTEIRKQAGTIQKQFFPGILGVFTIGILALLFGVVSLIMANKTTGIIVGLVTLIILSTIKFLEWNRTRMKTS